MLSASKKSDYVKTEQGNIIHRSAALHGIQNIVLKGHCTVQPNCVLRGDLRRKGQGIAIAISIGHYTKIDTNSVIKPPCKVNKNEFSYYPVRIGDYTNIGENCIVEAAQIGNHCKIGNNCVLGMFAIIKDCAEVADGSVVPPNTVVPSFTRFRGSARTEILK
jgi:dynactin-5